MFVLSSIRLDRWRLQLSENWVQLNVDRLQNEVTVMDLALTYALQFLLDVHFILQIKY